MPEVDRAFGMVLLNFVSLIFSTWRNAIDKLLAALNILKGMGRVRYEDTDAIVPLDQVIELIQSIIDDQVHASLCPNCDYGCEDCIFFIA